jgi:hypothetical protein
VNKGNKIILLVVTLGVCGCWTPGMTPEMKHRIYNSGQWGVEYKYTFGQVQQQGVITQKIGASDMYIFAPEGSTVRHIGTIKVGNTITIKYGIRVARNGKARFIAMDSAKVAKGIKPQLQTGQGDAEGFVVEDKRVPQMEIHVDPDLMKKVAIKADRIQAGRQTMSREANLNVEFINEGGKIKIGKVTVN